MKKILLAVAIVLMLVSPALAANIIPIFIDGTPNYPETVVQNNRIYVPLRFVSEELGAKVEWTNGAVEITTINRPPIVGDESFVKMVNNALDLLYFKDPIDYELVCKNAGEIKLTEATDYYGFNNCDSISIGKGLVNDKGRYNPIFLAGVLVHESLHNFNNKYGIVTAKPQENIAFLHEIAVLRILGAPQYQIDGQEMSRLRLINQ